MFKFESPNNVYLLREEAINKELNLYTVLKLEILILNLVGWNLLLDTPFSLASEFINIISSIEQSSKPKVELNSTFYDDDSNHISNSIDLTTNVSSEKSIIIVDFENVFLLLYYDYSTYRKCNSFIWTLACLKVVISAKHPERLGIFNYILDNYISVCDFHDKFKLGYSILCTLLNKEFNVNLVVANPSNCPETDKLESGDLSDQVESITLTPAHKGLDYNNETDTKTYNGTKYCNIYYTNNKTISKIGNNEVNQTDFSMMDIVNSPNVSNSFVMDKVNNTAEFSLGKSTNLCGENVGKFPKAISEFCIDGDDRDTCYNSNFNNVSLNITPTHKSTSLIPNFNNSSIFKGKFIKRKKLSSAYLPSKIYTIGECPAKLKVKRSLSRKNKFKS